MQGRRGLLAIALALGVSAGCASSSAALDVPYVAPRHEVAVRELPPAPSQTQPVAYRLGESIGASLAAQELARAARVPTGTSRGFRTPPSTLVPEDWRPATHGRADPRLRELLPKEDSLAVLQLGELVCLEFSAATEPQEDDTLGYWEEFHLGRTQDLLLDVAWTWRQGPAASLIGLIGAPRTLDRDIEDEILDPALVFVALGVHVRW